LAPHARLGVFDGSVDQRENIIALKENPTGGAGQSDWMKAAVAFQPSHRRDRAAAEKLGSLLSGEEQSLSLSSSHLGPHSVPGLSPALCSFIQSVTERGREMTRFFSIWEGKRKGQKNLNY
jgi:hypothetical protein